MFSIHWFKHWDKIFWLFFLLMAVTVVTAGAAGVIPFEYSVLLGVFMVIMGSGKLASEISHRRILNYQNDTYKKIHQMSQHLEKTFSLASMNKERTEFRIHKLDQKRKESEIRLNRSYRELARKVIDLENRLNKTNKMLDAAKKR